MYTTTNAGNAFTSGVSERRNSLWKRLKQSRSQ